MSLSKTDFLLTQSNIDAINNYFVKMAGEYYKCGENPPGSVSVEFAWVPGLGRFVTAKFDGENEGFEIEVMDESVSKKL